MPPRPVYLGRAAAEGLLGAMRSSKLKSSPVKLFLDTSRKASGIIKPSAPASDQEAGKLPVMLFLEASMTAAPRNIPQLAGRLPENLLFVRLTCLREVKAFQS